MSSKMRKSPLSSQPNFGVSNGLHDVLTATDACLKNFSTPAKWMRASGTRTTVSGNNLKPFEDALRNEISNFWLAEGGTVREIGGSPEYTSGTSTFAGAAPAALEGFYSRHESSGRSFYRTERTSRRQVV
jgi:hypothetical protein